MCYLKLAQRKIVEVKETPVLGNLRRKQESAYKEVNDGQWDGEHAERTVAACTSERKHDDNSCISQNTDYGKDGEYDGQGQ